jgi:hypothetical protein
MAQQICWNHGVVLFNAIIDVCYAANCWPYRMPSPQVRGGAMVKASFAGSPGLTVVKFCFQAMRNPLFWYSRC